MCTQAGLKCTAELNDLQSVLTKQLGSWCPFVVKRCVSHSLKVINTVISSTHQLFTGDPF